MPCTCSDSYHLDFTSFSAEELQANIAKHCSPDLPHGSGLKSEEPDGSWSEAQQIALSHKDRRELLSEERVQVL